MTPLILPLISDSLGATTRQFVWDFSLGMLVPAAVLPLVALHSARLMAEHRQWNTLLEGAPALTILAFVLLWPPSGLLAPLLLGTLLGYVLQVLALSLLADRQSSPRPSYRISLSSPQWIALRGMLGMMLLGQFLMSWVTPIDVASAVKIGAGAVAQLGYAERVLSLFLGVGAVAIARAVLPVFSEVAARQDWTRLRRLAVQWGALMLAAGVVLAALMWWGAPWIVKLLFERGAFDAEATTAVTEVFRWGLSRLPFYFAGLVFVQLLVSQRGFGLMALVALSCALSKFVLNEFLVAHLGVSGINLASGVMYAWSSLWLLVGGLWLIRRRLACA
jgi:peptidoglycan biosynthesis protein MviN/MurJ (putative lipid II flippase)